MPRTARSTEGGMIYHVLNRGNGRMRLFHKTGDYEAFERVLAEGLERYPMELLTYCAMPNHWHLVVRPKTDESLRQWAEQWQWSALWRRMHGAGDLPLSPWPMEQPRNWLAWVNRQWNAEQLGGIRTCVQRGRPLGDENWVRQTAVRLGLAFTLRGPGRPQETPKNQ